MKSKQLILILPFLLSACLCFATGANNIRFNRLTVDDGLPANGVMDVCQDSDGFIWFATEGGGLARYDGYSFKVYQHNPSDTNSIASNEVMALACDGKGNLWVGTYGNGVDRMNLASGQFTHYNHIPDSLKGVHGKAVYTLSLDSADNLWIGTVDKGLQRLHLPSGSFHYYDTSRIPYGGVFQAHCTMVDHEGVLWLATFGGLHRYVDEQDTFITYEQNGGDLSGSMIFSLFESNDRKEIWIGTMGPNSGICRYNRADDRIYRLEEAFDIKSVSLIFQDQQNRWWYNGYNQGMYRFDPSLRDMDLFTFNSSDPYSLSSNIAKAVYIDPKGSIWLTTNHGGVNRIDPRNPFHHYRNNPDDETSLVNDAMWGFYEEDDENIWVATSLGLDHLNTKSNEFTHFFKGIFASQMIKHGDELWACSVGHGILRRNLKSGKYTNYTPTRDISQRIREDIVNTICIDHKEQLWAGYMNGLDIMKLHSGEITNTRRLHTGEGGLPDERIAFLLPDTLAGDSIMWIGTMGGLVYYNYKTDTLYSFLKRSDLPEAIQAMRVTSLCKSTEGNVLYIGTDMGLVIFDYARQQFRKYSTNEGLSNNLIWGVMEDAQGRVWLTTHHGLSCFYPDELKFVDYYETDGLPGNEFNSNAYHMGASGKIYAGGNKGFVSFNPNVIKDEIELPRVRLTTFKVQNMERIPDGGLTNTRELELSYKDFLFSLEFSALDYVSAPQIQYAYKMEGLSDEWIYTDAKNRLATFTGLPAGTYHFRLKAAKNFGQWGPERVLVITITPPFHQTLVFKILMLQLIALLLLALYLARIRYLKQQTRRQETFSRELIQSREAERKRIAAELHDSLGQNLMLTNNALQQHVIINHGGSEQLDGAAETLKIAIKETRAISYNLHPHQLDKLGLSKAIESAIKNAARASEIKFDYTVQDIDGVLPKEHEIHIYRLVQEALNNIIKHSGAKLAQFNIARTPEGGIELKVSDNGKGFNLKNTEKQGIGLTEMQERVNIIGGRMFFDTAPGRGTRLEVWV